MHHTQVETRQWADACLQAGNLSDSVDVFLFPSFTCLSAARASMPVSVRIGAQNIHDQGQGAFTGEISAAMIADTGASAVLVGHSERRKYFGESNDFLARKLVAALGGGLIPFYCVGETLEEREAGLEAQIVYQQLEEGLALLTSSDLNQLVVAYEPVWAIGTGRTATPEDADAMHRRIRQFLSGKFGSELSERIRILYGGSVNGLNAGSLLASADIDGFLVGGASLDWSAFHPILQVASQRRR